MHNTEQTREPVLGRRRGRRQAVCVRRTNSRKVWGGGRGPGGKKREGVKEELEGQARSAMYSVGLLSKVHICQALRR